MGDLMHALPALTEAKEHFKEIEFDWVVDKSFSEVPKWHPAVNKIITTDHRNWKKQLLSSNSRKAFRSESIPITWCLHINDTSALLRLFCMSMTKS